MSDPWIETQVPENLCPYCGKKLDAASGEGTPSPGDVSVCIECASPLMFTDELTLRVMTRAEFADLPPATRADLRRYQAAVRKLDRSSTGA